MSTELVTIQDTGVNGSDLTLTSFYGGKPGIMVQLTQDSQYVQLTVRDCYKLTIELANFIKDQTRCEAEKLQKKIDEDQELKNTILQDAVECEHFISDLKLIEIPLRLLS